jgi:hypothetical protein
MNNEEECYHPKYLYAICVGNKRRLFLTQKEAEEYSKERWSMGIDWEDGLTGEKLEGNNVSFN